MHLGSSHNPALGGTWALKQVGAASEFNTGQATRIAVDAALAFDDLAGFSVRVEWRDLEPTKNNYTTAILDAAKARADFFGLPLAIRFMAGFRCPDYLYTTDGCRFFSSYDRGAIGINTAGSNTIGTLNFAIGSSDQTLTINETGSTQPVPEVPFTIQVTGGEFIKVPTRTLISGNQYRYGTSGSNPLQRAATSGTTTNSATGHGIGASVTIGGRIPDPCTTAGGNNTIFANRWEALVAVLATWCRAQTPTVPFLHMAWHGLYWSEIYNDSPLLPTDGRPGYATSIGGQSQALITAHKDLVTRASAYTGADLAMEGSNSGHGASGQILTQLQAHIRATFGDNTPRFYIQANNIVPGTVTGWPQGISKGLQLESSTATYTQAEWQDIYRNILWAPQRGDYIEPYVGPQFTGSGSQYLQTEITRFANLIAPSDTISGNVTYTTETTVPVGETLRFDPNVSTTLTMDNKNLIVYGTLEMRPANAGVIHTLKFINVNEANYVGAPLPVQGGTPSMTPVATDVGLWVMDEGILDAVGTPKVGWNRTGTDPTWQAGDEMLRVPWAINDYSTFQTHTLGTTPFSVVDPYGTTQTQEVFNLTRNVRFEGTATGRAHVLIMTPGVTQTVKYASFRWMGPRTPVGGQDISNEIRGRWSGIHFHHMGDTNSIAEGIVARDGGSHAYVSHASNNTTFRDCISYGMAESAFWWDVEVADDLSSNVTYDHCLSAKLIPIPSFRGVGLSGFYLANDSGTVTDCVSVGNQGGTSSSGFQWPENGGPDSAGAGVWVNSGNVAHNNKRLGLFVWQNNQNTHIIQDFTAYRNGEGAVLHGSYLNRYLYERIHCFQNATDANLGLADFEFFAVNGTALPTRGLEFRHLDCESVMFMEHHLPSVAPVRIIDSTLGVATINEKLIQDGGSFDIIHCDLEPADWTVLVMHPNSIYRVQRLDNTAYQVNANGTTTVIAPFEAFPVSGTGAYAPAKPAFAATGAESNLPIGIFNAAKPSLAGVGTHQLQITGTAAFAPRAASFQSTGTATSGVVGNLHAGVPTLAGVGQADVFPITGVDAAPFRLRALKGRSAVRGAKLTLVRGEGGPRTRVAMRVRPRRSGGYLRARTSPVDLRTGGGKIAITATGAFAPGVPTLAGLGASGAVVGTGAFGATKPAFAGTGAESYTSVGAFAASAAAFAGSGQVNPIADGHFAAAAPALSGTGTTSAIAAGAFGASAPAFAATGAESMTGAGDLAASNAVLAGTGTETLTSTGAFVAAAAVFAGAGEITGASATGAFAAAAASFAGTGFLVSDGVGDFRPAAAVLAGTGLVGMVGTGTFDPEPASLAGTGTNSSTATGAFDGGAAALAGAGVVTIAGTGTFLAGAAVLVGNAILTHVLGEGGIVADVPTLHGEAQAPVNATYDVGQPIGKWRMSLQTRSG